MNGDARALIVATVMCLVGIVLVYVSGTMPGNQFWLTVPGGGLIGASVVWGRR